VEREDISFAKRSKRRGEGEEREEREEREGGREEAGGRRWRYQHAEETFSFIHTNGINSLPQILRKGRSAFFLALAFIKHKKDIK
jgi:hypothetical protein